MAGGVDLSICFEFESCSWPSPFEHSFASYLYALMNSTIGEQAVHSRLAGRSARLHCTFEFTIVSIRQTMIVALDPPSRALS